MKRGGGLLVLIAVPATAQDLVIPPASYPDIAASGANAAAFVPNGWAIERQATGDISADGLRDLAFVLKEADPKKILANDGFGSPRVDTNPRILIVALGERDGFRRVVTNHTLIPRFEIPTLSDPFGEDGGMEIKNGALQITLFHFANMGGWDMGGTTFSFRWQADALRLIGYDRGVVIRNTGRMDELSINLLTRRVKVSHGTIDNDRPTVRWYRYAPRQAPTIDQIGPWDEYDPGGWACRALDYC